MVCKGANNALLHIIMHTDYGMDLCFAISDFSDECSFLWDTFHYVLICNF